MSVEMYASGDSVVAGLVPATSRRYCGRVSICEISVSADVWEKCHTKGWWPAPGRPLLIPFKAHNLPINSHIYG